MSVDDLQWSSQGEVGEIGRGTQSISVAAGSLRPCYDLLKSSQGYSPEGEGVRDQFTFYNIPNYTVSTP